MEVRQNVLDFVVFEGKADGSIPKYVTEAESR